MKRNWRLSMEVQNQPGLCENLPQKLKNEEEEQKKMKIHFIKLIILGNCSKICV